MKHAKLFKLGILLTIFGFALGGGYIVSRYATTEGHGKITPQQPSEQPQAQPVTQKTLESAYMNAVYSSSYSDVKNLGEGPAELERIRLVEPKMGGYAITVTIKSIGVEEMFDDSAYRFRKESVVEYTEQPISENITIMRRNDNSEATAFVKGERYYAIVSVTTTRPHEDIKKEVEAFASSIVWR